MPDPKMLDTSYPEFVNERFTAADTTGSHIVFTNRGAEHARIVMAKLVSGVSSSLDILSGHLSSLVYDEALLRACANRLSPGKIRIIVSDKEIPIQTTALAGLKDEIHSGQILVKRLDLKAYPKTLNHFALADRKHIRAESDHQEMTAMVILHADQRKVVGADGIPTTVISIYEQLFSVLWEGSFDYAPAVSEREKEIAA
ncbi:MAG: hypothetical protein QOF41_3028 [Methylobacteriaceae bacterium]|nr:hypothetical protein [Methylobacteriaceae bacterium]